MNHANLVAYRVVGERMFLYLVAVLVNQRVCGIDNAFCRAIVLLELESAYFGIYFFQVQNVVDVCTAKSVDALRVVAHNKQVAFFLCQLKDYHVLRKIDVLILVDQDILKEVLIFLPNVGIVA